MNRSLRPNVVSALIAAIVVLTPAAASLRAGPAVSTDGPLQSMPGWQVVLIADPSYNPYHVAPPAQFSRSGVQSIQTATINVNYIGAWSSQAQTAFQYAVDLWETQITSAAPIQVDANWTALGPTTLGSAGPVQSFRDFPGAPVAGTWYPSALANKLRGADLDGAAADIDANFNSTFSSWYFGTDGNTPAGQYDFASVVLHELGHGLGFLGSMRVTIASGLGSWGGGTGFPFTYDRFAVNGSGQLLISAFPNNSAALAAQLTGNDIYFNGTLARQANGGNNVKLYAPASWQAGSSYAHLDEIFNGTPNALMTYSLSTGESIHNPGPVMLGMFQDMGWTTAAPQPDLSIVKQVVGSASLNPGSPVTFRLSIQNAGGATATGVVVTDTLSSYIQSPSWSASASLAGISAQGGAAYTWNLPNLGAGASGVITVTGTINLLTPQPTAIVNTATIRTAVAESSTSNNTSSAIVIVGALKVHLPDVMKNYEPPSQWSTIVSENFEGAFPGVWNVYDQDGSINGTYFWGKRTCLPYAGSFSGWAVGGGASGGALACGSPYPDNADAWMVYGPFSLADATAADLTFKLWLNSQLSFDTICRLSSVDGTNFSGSCTSGNTAGWVDKTLDLSSLLGEANVWVALNFTSDESIHPSVGAYVDNLVLRKCTVPTCASGSSAAEVSGTGDTREVFVNKTLNR